MALRPLTQVSTSERTLWMGFDKYRDCLNDHPLFLRLEHSQLWQTIDTIKLADKVKTFNNHQVHHKEFIPSS